MAAARVYVLYTGGTFGMTPDLDLPGHPLVPASIEEILPRLQKTRDILNAEDIEVVFDSLPDGSRIDSASMTPKDWIVIAQCIYGNYELFDGFVVIQGTDTLAYTASALSFMFENLGKPIIVTGSQLPLESDHTDAELNYLHAVLIAGYKATKLPRIPEVVVVFGNKILRGCRTRKMSTSNWTGFDSPNAPPLGVIAPDIRISASQLRPAPEAGQALLLHTALVTDVLDIALYPGMRSEHLGAMLHLDHVKGVVIRTYGAGNAPQSPEFLQTLRDGIQDGARTIVNVTQCAQGAVEMGLYASSVALADLGVLSGQDMTPEAALTKMMVVLGTQTKDQIRVQMGISQRGEQSQSLFDLNFCRRDRLSSERYSQIQLADRRFRQSALSAAVLRIAGLEISLDDEAEDASFLHVFIDPLRAAPPDRARLDEAACLYRIDLAGRVPASPFGVVQLLPKDKVKTAMCGGGIALTLAPSKGVRFKFEKLSLSLFTCA
jgi:L-asparaginase